MAEPEWDEQTRELAIAHATWDRCSACGGPVELCQDPERQYDFTVPLPKRCHRTTALLEAQARVTDETNPFSQALLWTTELREGGAQ